MEELRLRNIEYQEKQDELNIIIEDNEIIHKEELKELKIKKKEMEEELVRQKNIFKQEIQKIKEDKDEEYKGILSELKIEKNNAEAALKEQINMITAEMQELKLKKKESEEELRTQFEHQMEELRLRNTEATEDSQKQQDVLNKIIEDKERNGRRISLTKEAF